MLKGVLRQSLVIAALVLMLLANLGLGASPTDLEGQSRVGMYARYPNAFAPHPYTFAIWLPIFLGAITFAIYQALPSQRSSPVMDSAGTWLAFGYVLVAGTVFVGLGPSNIIVTLALAAMAAGLYASSSADHGLQRWLVRFPAGLFTGWLLVATTLNLCQLLTSLGVAVTPSIASVLMVVAAVAALDIARRSREGSVLLAVMWAFTGIIAARPDEELIWAASGIGLLSLGVALASQFPGRLDGGNPASPRPPLRRPRITVLNLD